jgi:hypothetical protein
MKPFAGQVQTSDWLSGFLVDGVRQVMSLSLTAAEAASLNMDNLPLSTN